MRVVLVVGLILVELDPDEVGLDGLGVERQADEGVDGGGFGDQAEGPGLRRVFLVGRKKKLGKRIAD